MSMAAEVSRSVSEDGGVRRAVICPAQGVGANDDCSILIDDHGFVGQRLRFGGINRAADDRLDESFFIAQFPGIKSSDEFVVQYTPERSCVVILLGSNPQFFQLEDLLFRAGGSQSLRSVRGSSDRR